jgi:hypothetical protein
MPGASEEIGKGLVISGAVLILLGVVLVVSGKLPFPGRLPGDIMIQKKNFTFCFPIVTCIIASIVLTLFLWVLGRRL